MKTPGEMLREARVERGLSLSDAAAMTRISRTMLAHLERDRYDEFNADVFVRGHLRNYARELEISSDEVLQAYERHTGAARAPAASIAVTSVAAAPARSAAPTPKNGAKSSSKNRMSPARTAPAAERGPKGWAANLNPTHAVAVLLVLVGVVVFASLLSGNRATAKDGAQYPTASREAWELEQDVEETRWLLEQPVQDVETTKAARR